MCHNSTAQFHWNNRPTTGEQLSEDQMATMKTSQNNSRQWKRTSRREYYKDKPGQESHGSGSTRRKRQVQHSISTSQHSISTNQQSTSTSHHNVTQAAACGNPTTTSTTTEAKTRATSCSTLQAHNQDACTTTAIHSSSAPFGYVTQ